MVVKTLEIARSKARAFVWKISNLCVYKTHLPDYARKIKACARRAGKHNKLNKFCLDTRAIQQNQILKKEHFIINLSTTKIFLHQYFPVKIFRDNETLS